MLAALLCNLQTTPTRQGGDVGWSKKRWEKEHELDRKIAETLTRTLKGEVPLLAPSYDDDETIAVLLAYELI